MSDLSVGGLAGRNAVQQMEELEKLPQIIDVMTGEGTDRCGIHISIVAGPSGPGAIDGIGDLTPSQVEDLQKLLELLGLDSENAKNATMITVLKAIQSAIKQQSLTVSTCTKAISDYDVARLNALKEALQGSEVKAAKDIIQNIDWMMAHKGPIEDLVNNKGMVFDGKFEDCGEGPPSNPNFELNSHVRFMGDRIGDIRYHNARMPDGLMDQLLDKLAPAMKTAVKDLLNAYNNTTGWGTTAHFAYAKMGKQTLVSLGHVIASPDMVFPPHISKDALLQVLKEILESLSGDPTAEQIEEKMEEKMQELLAQMNDVAVEMPVQA